MSAGDGDILQKQAIEFLEGISSSEKRLHLFELAKDGSDDHSQLDNRSRGAQVMFDWLDGVFDYGIEDEPLVIAEFGN